MKFKKSSKFETVGYCDADYGPDTEGRKSVSGYVFTKKGAAIAWGSKRQQTTALSTCEAEYMAMGVAVQEALWLRSLEGEIFNEKLQPTVLHCDNQSAIQLALNESYHPRTKHIDIRHHFIRDYILRNKISLKHVSSEKMVADMMTKSLPYVKIEYFINEMGLNYL